MTPEQEALGNNAVLRLYGARPVPPRPPWRNTGQREEQVAELRAAGWPVHLIASRLGVAHDTAAADLRRWRKRQRRLAEAARLRDEGLSLRQIARQMKVDVHTIHRDLAKCDVARSEAVTVLHPPVPSTRCIRPADATPEGRVIEFRRPR